MLFIWKYIRKIFSKKQSYSLIFIDNTCYEDLANGNNPFNDHIYSFR